MASEKFEEKSGLIATEGLALSRTSFTHTIIRLNRIQPIDKLRSGDLITITVTGNGTPYDSFCLVVGSQQS